MKRKRTSLDSILTRTVDDAVAEAVPAPPPMPVPVAREADGSRPGVKQQTAYLKLPVYEQLRRLAFEERRKMHDYIIEGLDLVFRKRGLPGIEEMEGKGA
jgi:hypothetical protein